MPRVDVRAATEERLAALLKANPDVATLCQSTPAQIDAWVDANITTLAQVRRAMKLLLKLLVIVLRKQA